MRVSIKNWAQAALAVGLLGAGGCIIDGGWGTCETTYSNASGFCQACDCGGCYPTDDYNCQGGGNDACSDGECLEGCYYDGSSESCVETAVCTANDSSSCLSDEHCDVSRNTCVPNNRPTCTSICGDGIVDAGEQCDDGNTVSGDGCSSFCTIETAENCSDWADNDGDGLIDCADPDCANDPSCQNGFCGDGVLEPGEQCDDGNNTGGDGCSSLCTIEQPGTEICNDGADNDQDGLADCADPDCANDPACQPVCVTSSDCPTGDVCTNGICCSDGSCIPNGRDPTCQFDYQCGNGSCVNGFCADACAADTDCAVGNTCQNGLCQTDPTGGGQCIFDADCVASGAGEYCINGFCHQSCTSDASCASDETCRDGICQPNDGPKSQCRQNADCPISGQDCVNAVCRFACDNDTDCTTSCGSGSACNLGFCLFPNEVAPQCQVNTDCTSGLVCQNATCVAVP